MTDYYHVSPHLKPENFPSNDTTSGLAAGLAEAHNAYGEPRWIIPSFFHSHSHLCSAYILFVVQPNERNVFDQRWLEYKLLEKFVAAQRTCTCVTFCSYSRSHRQTFYPHRPSDPCRTCCHRIAYCRSRPQAFSGSPLKFQNSRDIDDLFPRRIRPVRFSHRDTLDCTSHPRAQPRDQVSEYTSPTSRWEKGTRSEEHTSELQSQ